MSNSYPTGIVIRETKNLDGNTGSNSNNDEGNTFFVNMTDEN